MSAHSPGKRGDALVLQEILHRLTQATADYNVILALVHEHCAALTVLRTRVVAMRESVKEWDDGIWNMALHAEIPGDARANAQGKVRAFATALDDLSWQLWDFRQRDGGRS